MMQRSRVLLAALLLAASAKAQPAPTYHEITRHWFLDPRSPNWTCADSRAPCFAPTPNHYAFHGAYLVRHRATLFAYVQGGGNPGPCRVPGGADNFCVFTVPDTPAGWRGEGLSLRNHWPRPDDGAFWQLRSAFRENGRVYLLASRTASGSTAAIEHMEAMLGESTDGATFSWSVLLRARRSALGGIRLEDYVLLPHPKKPGLWVGTLTWFTPEGRESVTPWKVDRRARTVSLPAAGGEWRSLPAGGTLTFAPSAVAEGRITNLQLVTHDGALRLEAWGAVGVSYDAGAGLAHNPCPPGFPRGATTPRYLTNRIGRDQRGSSTVEYRHFDPDTLQFATARTPITSEVRALPSDYLQALSWMAFRFDAGGRAWLYTGSKDAVICDAPLTWNPWSGSGILVTELSLPGATR